MATYQRQTNQAVFQPYIYQQPMEMIAQNLATREAKYDAGALSAASAYQNALNLEVTTDDSQNFINQTMQSLKPEIQKLSSVDFSIQTNVDKAHDLFKPITSNMNVITDVATTKFYKKQFDKYNTYLQSNDPKVRALANDENLKHMSYGYNAFKEGGWSNIQQTAANKRSYVPHVDVTSRLMDGFKKYGIDVTVEKTNEGGYIIKQKNGENASPYFQDLAMSMLDGESKRQLAIYAENSYTDIASNVLVGKPNATQADIGKYFLEIETTTLNNNKQSITDNVNKINPQLDTLLAKGKGNLSEDELEQLNNLQSELKMNNDASALIDNRLKDISELTDDNLMALGGLQSYTNTYTKQYINNIADTYANATYSQTVRPDQVKMQLRDQIFKRNMAEVNYQYQKSLDNNKANNQSALSYQASEQAKDLATHNFNLDLNKAQWYFDRGLNNSGNPVESKKGNTLNDKNADVIPAMADKDPNVLPTNATEMKNALEQSQREYMDYTAVSYQNKINNQIGVNYTDNLDGIGKTIIDNVNNNSNESIGKILAEGRKLNPEVKKMIDLARKLKEDGYLNVYDIDKLMIRSVATALKFKFDEEIKSDEKNGTGGSEMQQIIVDRNIAYNKYKMLSDLDKEVMEDVDNTLNQERNDDIEKSYNNFLEAENARIAKAGGSPGQRINKSDILAKARTERYNKKLKELSDQKGLTGSIVGRQSLDKDVSNNTFINNYNAFETQMNSTNPSVELEYLKRPENIEVLNALRQKGVIDRVVENTNKFGEVTMTFHLNTLELNKNINNKKSNIKLDWSNTPLYNQESNTLSFKIKLPGTASQSDAQWAGRMGYPVSGPSDKNYQTSYQTLENGQIIGKQSIRKFHTIGGKVLLNELFSPVMSKNTTNLENINYSGVDARMVYQDLIARQQTQSRLMSALNSEEKRKEIQKRAIKTKDGWVIDPNDLRMIIGVNDSDKFNINNFFIQR